MTGAVTVRTTGVRAMVRRAAVALLTAPIRVYQLVVSPLLGPRCRFYPSCSSYAVTALRRHGPVRGTGLALWRLLRCHPWHPGGNDPVPPTTPTHRSASVPSAEPTTRAPHGAGT